MGTRKMSCAKVKGKGLDRQEEEATDKIGQILRLKCNISKCLRQALPTSYKDKGREGEPHLKLQDSVAITLV